MISPYAVIYLVASIVPAIIGFFALILYTHLLSPAEYGIFVVGSSIAGMVSAIFFTWVRLSVSRYQARAPKLDLRAEVVVAYSVTVVIIAGLTPAVMLIARPNISFSIIAGSLFLSLSVTAFEISQEFRRARLNPRRLMIIALIRSILGLTLGYTAVAYGGGGLGLLVAMGMSFLIANILSFQRSAGNPLRLGSIDYLKQFVRYGAPFSFGAMTVALHNALDRVGVAYLLGQSEAGYYGLAADIPRQLINLLASSVASAMFPIAFLSLAKNGVAATRERLKEGAELLLALIVPVTVWLAISADAIAGALLGTEFQTSVAALLPLLVIGRMCGAINQFYLHVSFQLAEKPLLQVVHDSSVLVLNLAFLFPLTIGFGLPGTAASVLIAEGLGVLIGIWLSRKAFRLPFNGWGMARVLASTAMMAGATYAAKTTAGGHGLLSLLSMAGTGGLAYMGAAMLLDVAGVRSSIGSFLWPRSVAAE